MGHWEPLSGIYASHDVDGIAVAPVEEHLSRGAHRHLRLGIGDRSGAQVGDISVYAEGRSTVDAAVEVHAEVGRAEAHPPPRDVHDRARGVRIDAGELPRTALVHPHLGFEGPASVQAAREIDGRIVVAAILPADEDELPAHEDVVLPANLRTHAGRTVAGLPIDAEDVGIRRAADQEN